MAKFVLTDAVVSVGGTDLSDHVKSVTLPFDRDLLEATAMGDDTHIIIAGLYAAGLTVEFYQDLAASEVHATIKAAIDSASPTALAVRATSGALDATNPEVQFSGWPESYPFLSNGVGEVAMTTVTFKPAGSLTWDVTP